MIPFGSAPTLTQVQFHAVADLARRGAGIDLKPGKEELVRTRLARRLRARGLGDFDAYLDLVRRDDTGDELTELLDALTTNQTDFYREPAHFDYLAREMVPGWSTGSAPIRVWSAGCSTGAEAYTIAMELHDRLPAHRFGATRILATDISNTVLARARAGRYPAAELTRLPEGQRRKHFAEVEDGGQVRVAPYLMERVAFARLNLMSDWPMRGPFDLVMCRNVMIYFDRPTRAALVERFAALLRTGGHLFVGHAESLTAGPSSLRYVQPAVYRKA